MEKTPTLSLKDFPIFAPMRAFDFPEHVSPQLAEDPDRSHWIMCLWKQEDDVCSLPCGDFTSFLGHLRHDHGVDLRPNLDFCDGCEIIFKSRAEVVNHYLEKALMFEDKPLKIEGDGDKEMNEFLSNVFKVMKNLRKNLLDEILFTEEMPPLETIDIREGLGGLGYDTCDCHCGRRSSAEQIRE